MSTIDLRINWMIARTHEALKHVEGDAERWSLTEQLRLLEEAKRDRQVGMPGVLLPAFVTFDGETFHSMDDELPGIPPGRVVIDDGEHR